MPRGYGIGRISLVRRYIRKRTFTTEERVLVHLSADGLRPEDVTQEGIAGATRSGRSTLTKWLDRLERRGLVTRDRIRLPDHPLPKFGYRLSDPGWQAAAALCERLAADIVTVRAPNLGELPVRLVEVTSLGPVRIDMTAAVASTRKGRLDLARAMPSSRDLGPPVWGTRLRHVDRLFGRTEEMSALDAWWAAGRRLLLVTGMAGIGKSSLVAVWIGRRHPDVPVYGFEIRPSTTPAALLSDFGAFLASLGKPALAVQLDQGVPLDSEFVSRLVRRDLEGMPILAVLDNADQASRDVARLVRRLFLQDLLSESARLVLVGRRVPRWAQEGGRGEGGSATVQLGGLDSEAAAALLHSRGVAPESGIAEEIVRTTRGHPLLLHLAAAHGTAGEPDVARYLAKEVWGALTARDRRVLEAASIFRRPFASRVLETVAGVDTGTLASLAEQNLLERTISGGYTMHDLVRDSVAARLAEPRARRLHSRIADVLLSSAESRDRWEGLYHLLKAGRVREASGLLDAKGPSLLDSVAAEEIAALARELTLDESDPVTYAVFAEVLGDSLRIRGHIAPALFQYGHARRLAEGTGQANRVPRLLRKMAFLERCRNRYSKALGYLVEARARIAPLDDPSEKAEILRELALVEQSLGDLASASAHLSEAVDLATDMADPGVLSRALLALGSLETRRGHLEEGLGYDLEGLRVAERSGSLTETAHAHIVVGTTLQEMGRLAESLRHHETGLEIARLLGNLRLMAYATMNRTGTLISLRRHREAGSALQEAQGYFVILEERDTLALLKTYEGQLEMGLGHWARAKRAWEDGLAALRTYGSPADLVMALKEIGGFYEEHGERGAGRDRLLEAREIAAKLKNAGLVADIEAMLVGEDRPPSPGQGT